MVEIGNWSHLPLRPTVPKIPYLALGGWYISNLDVINRFLQPPVNQISDRAVVAARLRMNLEYSAMPHWIM